MMNMTTSEEIIKKYGVNKNEPMLKDMLDEARADTAKQIFKEMESKGVLVHREAIEGTKKNNYVRFKASVYQALKKKYKIEE